MSEQRQKAGKPNVFCLRICKNHDLRVKFNLRLNLRSVLINSDVDNHFMYPVCSALTLKTMRTFIANKKKVDKLVKHVM